MKVDQVVKHQSALCWQKLYWRGIRFLL